MTANAAGEGELFKELPQALFVFALVGVNLGISSLQIYWTKHTRGAMPRSGEEDHVEVVLLDQAVQVSVDKRQARTRSPVPQEAILDVLWFEGLLQQRIVLQINHA
jgi:hypothetical protein